MGKHLKTNPFTGKKDRSYQVNKKEIGVEYAYLKEDDFPSSKRYVISSKGDLFWEDYRNNIGVVHISDKNGYRVIYIQDLNCGKKKMKIVHRLVAKYFVKKTKKDILFNRDTVHFIDWNRTRLIPENLIWVNDEEMKTLIAFYRAKKSGITIDDDLKYRYLKKYYENSNYTKKEIKRIFREFSL